MVSDRLTMLVLQDSNNQQMKIRESKIGAFGRVINTSHRVCWQPLIGAGSCVIVNSYKCNCTVWARQIADFNFYGHLHTSRSST